MDKCFVIQPFDGGRFDQRYKEIFAPAIEKAGLEPYRVDLDTGATIPIAAIEEQIRQAKLCLADISLDNPNVWYEVGFAIAAGKDVLLVSEGRQDLPFDIRHRTVLIYKRDGPGDFRELRRKITERLKALLEKGGDGESPERGAGVSASELKAHERFALRALFRSSLMPGDAVPVERAIETSLASGLDRDSARLAFTALQRKSLVEFRDDIAPDGTVERWCLITPSGIDWLIERGEEILVGEKQEEESTPFDY